MSTDFNFENYIGIQLSSTAIVLKKLVSTKFEEHNFPISFDDWLNLLPIIRQDGISQKSLAEILGKDKTTISRLIDSLILKGVVKRKNSKNDRRSVELYLTDKGIALHRSVLPVIESCNNNSLEKLSKKEFEFLMKILSKLRIDF
jgi:DNA-binding MarR family transcriptional regulator